MILHVLGSSSKGNCYLLESEKECLILECGVRLLEVKKTLNFNMRKVVGCIATHQHHDHVGYLQEFLKSNIPIYTNDETVDAVEVEYGELLHGMPEKSPFWLSGFRITPFYVPHDNTPCFAYKIYHKDIGTLLFLTDLAYCKYRFKDVSQILVESNYSKDMLDQDNPKYAHVVKGHMELQETLEFLRTNDNPLLMNVVLLHLSDSSSNSEKFIKSTKEVVPMANVYVADAGMEIKLNKEPF